MLESPPMPYPKLHAYLVALRSVALGANIRSLPLLVKPHKMLEYSLEGLFLYGAMTNSRGLIRANVFEVFPQACTSDVTLWNLADTWFIEIPTRAVDIVSLCLLCRAIRPKAVFEIGTLSGYSSAHFSLNTPEDSIVYTLDLPPETKPSLPTTLADAYHADFHAKTKQPAWDNIEIRRKICPLFGDSATFDYSPYFGKIDLFFIDGAHSYEYVRSDTLNAVKCCHPGSVIAWHDFGRFGVNGVSKWLREFARDRKVYAIPSGSLAFCKIE